MNSSRLYKLKWSFRFFAIKVKNLIRYQKSDWVMGRVACLGQDVFKILSLDFPIVNIQKGRVDYLCDVIKKPNLKTKSNHVISSIERNDIKDLILQQEIFYNLKKSPIALYMDSFSELTDQRFLNKKQKWSFCANYSDILHTKSFEREFEPLGLLNVDDLVQHYRNFFSLFRMIYGSVPIIFIHFPVKLDRREKFKVRFKKINEAIDILQNEFQPFYSFKVDEEIVDWPDGELPNNETFPYHYNDTTYQNFADQIRASMALKKVGNHNLQ
jgi:hypothetical protein